MACSSVIALIKEWESPDLSPFTGSTRGSPWSQPGDAKPLRCLSARVRQVGSEQVPLSRHSPKYVCTSIREPEPRSGHEIFGRAGDQDLAWACCGSHAGADVHGDPAQFALDRLTLTSVQPGPYVEVQRARAVPDGAATTDRAGRAVKCGKHSVAHGIKHPSSVPFDFGPRHGLVRIEQGAPPPVANGDSPLGRRHDVGEQDGREHAVWLRTAPHAREELLDFIQQSVRIPRVGNVISRQFDEFCSRNLGTDIAALLDVDRAIAGDAAPALGLELS